MEKNLSFSVDAIQSIVVKLAWPQLEIFSDEIEAIQVLAAGDEHTVTELKVFEKEGRLTVEQPTYGLSMDIMNGKWMQVCIRLPKKWQGSVDASTISGLFSARGLRGRDIVLDTVSGDLRAMAIDGVMVSLKTVSGDIKAGGVTGEKLSLRSISGDMDVQGSAFKSIRTTSVSGDSSLEFTQPFERVDATTVSGDVVIRVPLDRVNATLRSVSGRIRTTGVELTSEGAQVHITGVSADLSLINTKM